MSASPTLIIGKFKYSSYLHVIAYKIVYITHRPCGSIAGWGVEACIIGCPLVSYPGTGNSCKKERSGLLKIIDFTISSDIVVFCKCTVGLLGGIFT